MKCEIQWIEPNKLKNVWDTVRKGLEITAIKAPGGWIPEDVYMKLKTGEAVIHLAIVDKRYAGFMVSQTVESLEGRKLLIWIAYSEAGGNILADNIEQVREWASNIGAVKIQFQSPRRGWEKAADKLGFVPTMQIYESEV